MDVEKIFHMTGGVGNTSYSNNSSFQKKASDMVKHITLETLQQCYLTAPSKSLAIADLGCSSGQNALSILKEMIKTIDQTCQKILQVPTPELRIYLNDLPTNDFNAIFKALPDFHMELRKERGENSKIYIAGYPGTFYGRLFPDKCMHFVYSSYSLHWLSKVPPAIYDEEGKSINKSNVYISKSSPPQVTQAYENQFKEDFSLFLRSRSEELVAGGQMVLILLGRSGPNHVDRGNTFLWEILSRSFAVLVSQGEIEEEKVNGYEVHFYSPSEEDIEDQVGREGSFKMDKFEMFEIEKNVGGCISYGAAVASTVRAIQESMISHHFGEGILDNLFNEYGRLVDEEMAIEEIRPITFIVVLKKL